MNKIQGQLRSIAEAIKEATRYDHTGDFAHPEGQTLCVCEDCNRVFRAHPSRKLCRRPHH